MGNKYFCENFLGNKWDEEKLDENSMFSIRKPHLIHHSTLTLGVGYGRVFDFAVFVRLDFLNFSS
jgi:hypothetical protein